MPFLQTAFLKQTKESWSPKGEEMAKPNNSAGGLCEMFLILFEAIPHFQQGSDWCEILQAIEPQLLSKHPRDLNPWNCWICLKLGKMLVLIWKCIKKMGHWSLWMESICAVKHFIKKWTTWEENITWFVWKYRKYGSRQYWAWLICWRCLSCNCEQISNVLARLPFQIWNSWGNTNTHTRGGGIAVKHPTKNCRELRENCGKVAVFHNQIFLGT